MSPEQQKFFEVVAKQIPEMIKSIVAGNYKAECLLGRKRVGDKVINLKLVATVEEPDEPAHGHSGASPK